MRVHVGLMYKGVVLGVFLMKKKLVEESKLPFESVFIFPLRLLRMTDYLEHVKDFFILCHAS